MRLGQAAMEALQAEVTGKLTPGDELVVAGPVALGGTSLIAQHKKEELSKYFSTGFLHSCVNLLKDYGVIESRKNPEKSEENQDKIAEDRWNETAKKNLKEAAEKSQVWEAAANAGASALYALGEGGFLSALWKMTEASQVGLEADLRKVPIRQETIEVCEIFDINPYKLCSEGSVLIGIRGGEALVQELRRMGYMAEIIGQANDGNDRLLYSGGNARFLERPAKDEIHKCISNISEE